MNDEKCRFFMKSKRYSCNALTDVQCDGINADCPFYRTDEQYDNAMDRAILINRARGNCEKCRYRLTPCKLTCE